MSLPMQLPDPRELIDFINREVVQPFPQTHLVQNPFVDFLAGVNETNQQNLPGWPGYAPPVPPEPPVSEYATMRGPKKTPRTTRSDGGKTEYRPMRERQRAKDPRLNKDGSFKNAEATTRAGAIPPEAQWINTLDNKTFMNGSKSVTSAVGVVLQNSGIKVSDRVALDFRKNAQNIIAQYNKTADPQHKNISDYYVLLTGYLQQLSEADTGPGGGEVVPGATPTEQPVDMSQYPGWNPNSGQQFASAQPGQNPITNRVNQLNAAGTAPPPQQGGMGLAQLLQSISPVSIGMQIGKGIRGG